MDNTNELVIQKKPKTNGVAQEMLLAELFVDTGEGFKRGETIRRYVSEGQNVIKFDFRGKHGFRALRFDPFPSACIVRNAQFFIIHIDGTEEEVFSNSTAKMVKNGNYFFLSDNPKFVIRKDFTTLVVAAFIIKIKYLSTDPNVVSLFDDFVSNNENPSAQMGQMNVKLLDQLKEKDQELKENKELFEKELQEYKRESVAMNEKVYAALNGKFNIQKEMQMKMDTNVEYMQTLKRSLSYRLGFMLTAPARYLYERYYERIFPMIANKTAKFVPTTKEDPYEVWLRHNELSNELRKAVLTHSKSFAYRPLVSIVIPVYNVEKRWLGKLVDSLGKQLYDNWEVCFADDKSTDSHVVPYLQNLTKKNEKFKAVYRKENGNISKATNSALEIAQGEFIIFMDNDDELHELALYEIVKLLNQTQEVDIIYTDEDKMDEEGKRFNPHFKPAFSPEHLMSYNYMNHLLCVRKELVDQVGGLRTAFDGTQDYDFILRLINHTKRVHHIPKILYHWRALSTSIAGDGASKASSMNFFAKGQKSLESHLKARNLTAEVAHPEFAKMRNLGLYEIAWPVIDKKVSIVILNESGDSYISKLLESIANTTYENYDVHIIANRSLPAYILNKSTKKITVHEIEDLDNKAAAFNQVVKSIECEYLLFMEETMAVLNDEWLQQLVGYLKLDGVGVVTPKIMKDSEVIYSAGSVNNCYRDIVDNLPTNTFKFEQDKELGYFFYPHITRNYGSAASHCFITKKHLFTNYEGFNTESFGQSYFSYDYANNLVKLGKRVVYTASAKVQVQAILSEPKLNVKEAYYFKEKYRDIDVDPFYNINFSDKDIFQVSPDNSFNFHRTEGFEQLKAKVLFVSHNFNFEGAPLQILEIIEGLLKKGTYEIHAFSPKDGPLRQKFDDLGVKTTVFDIHTNKSLGDYRRSIENFRKWVKKEEFDVLFANTLVTFYSIDAVRDLKIPVAWLIHESYEIHEFYKSYLVHDLRHRAVRCFKFTNKPLFVSKNTSTLYKKLDHFSNFQVINNALRLTEKGTAELDVSKRDTYRKSLNIAEDQLVFLNLGTVCTRKGQLDFVQAGIEFIQNEHITNALFYLVGGREDEYMDNIKAIIARANCEKYFRIVMETGDVEQYYLSSDVFVCTSYIESYPRVILEAMYYKLPIIATNIYGILEQVVPGVNGELFTPGNVISLADKLFKFYRYEDLRKKYADNAYYMLRLINSYEEMVDKYHDIIMGLYQSNYKNN